MRKRVFCWLPTPIYTTQYWQNGGRWLDFAWLDSDGKHYETEQPLRIDLDALLQQKRRG